MPDKIYKRGCGHRCIKCWKNKLNHGNGLKLKNHPKTGVYIPDIDEPDLNLAKQTEIAIFDKNRSKKGCTGLIRESMKKALDYTDFPIDPKIGLIIFNTTKLKYYEYNGENWEPII